jgi:hypothetical protein
MLSGVLKTTHETQRSYSQFTATELFTTNIRIHQLSTCLVHIKSNFSYSKPPAHISLIFTTILVWCSLSLSSSAPALVLARETLRHHINQFFLLLLDPRIAMSGTPPPTIYPPGAMPIHRPVMISPGSLPRSARRFVEQPLANHHPGISLDSVSYVRRVLPPGPSSRRLSCSQLRRPCDDAHQVHVRHFPCRRHE